MNYRISASGTGRGAVVLTPRATAAVQVVLDLRTDGFDDVAVADAAGSALSMDELLRAAEAEAAGRTGGRDR